MPERIECHIFDTSGRLQRPPWHALAAGAAVLIILIIHVVGRAGAFCSPIHADSFAYSSFACRIARGAVLYRDLHIDKPPGLMWLNAPVYLWAPRARWPLIPMESLALLLGYFAVYKVGRELYGRPVGIVLAVVAALAVNVFLLTDYTVEGFNLAESYMVLTASAAALYYTRGHSSNRPRALALAGAFLGVSLVLKQTALPLLAAVVLHRSLFDLVVARDRRAWGRNVAAVGAGLSAVLGPVVAVLAVQGVLGAAVESMTVRALPLLEQMTGWPARWLDVLPLWVPLAWCVVGLIGWCRYGIGGRPGRAVHATGGRGLPSTADVSFLLLWLILECVMLVHLPRRSFHYYALSSLPVIFLSGLFWAVLQWELAATKARSAKQIVAVAAIWSAAFVRPAVDLLVPTAVARYRTYDAEADQAFFDESLTRDNAILE